MSTVSVPAGWQETSRTEDTVCLESVDGKEQATLSVMHFASDATFEHFKRMCDLRYESEKEFLTDGFITPETPRPFTHGRVFGMFFSGGDKATGRVFSEYFSLLRRELLAIYLEGFAPAEATLESFKAFVAGLRRG